MKINTTTLKLIGIGIVIILLIICGCMWYTTSHELKATKTQLDTALTTVTTLQENNDKLVKYITEKDNKIKQIEKEYQEALANIPADVCGNTKPSQELLQYFRKNK